MIELLQIDPSANAEAVRRQLARLRTPRVAISLPEGFTELNNVARLRLLQRQAQIQKSDVALITWDEATRKAAQQVGIPVFARDEEAMRGRWRMSPELPAINVRKPEATLPEPPPWRRDEIVERSSRPSLHRARQARIRSEATYRQPLPVWLSWIGYAAAAALLLAVLGVFVRVVLPAATVTLVPGVEKISVTFPLVANPNLTTPDLQEGLLPARLVETTVEGSGTMATTGTQEQATLKATGQVVFSNLGSNGVNIPIGTVVGTGTGALIQFRTTVASGIDGGVGNKATVPIEAIKPGLEGNVRANSITNIDGPLRFRLRVTNPNGTSGGGTEFKRSVTEADLDNLTAIVRADLENGKDYQELQKKLQPGEWLAEESINTRILTQGFDHYRDEPADELNLTLRLGVSGSAVDEQALRQFLISRVQTALPEGAQLKIDTMTVQRVPGATRIGESVQFTVTVNGDYLVFIDPSEVSSKVVNLGEEEAAKLIQQNWNLAAPPEFYRDPELFGVMPMLPSRIQVRVLYGNE